MKERYKLLIILGLFALCWFLPADHERFREAVAESFALLRWYAREHVLLCLVPAFFIAGAISVFVNQGAVMKYLGPQASKLIALPVAAVSGSVLSVCSCTVLPLFASIHRMGAGLGPASAFLYSGPAINVLAIILTARVLGPQLGLARALGAVLFAVLIGLGMQTIYRKEEKAPAMAPVIPAGAGGRKGWQEALYFLAMLGVLVFANWGRPAADDAPLWHAIYGARWYVTAGFLLLLGFSSLRWFEREELGDWVDSSWDFAKQILPLLAAGVLAAGFFLGGPSGGQGVIPERWIAELVGGNSLAANFFASLVGALMYFATLTEVPILEGLLEAGMGQGPALSLLLAGPALSLPNMLVVRSVLGTQKTLVFTGLVVLLSTVAGYVYGFVHLHFLS